MKAQGINVVRQKFCNMNMKHNMAEPDAFTGVIKVTTHLGP